MSGPPFGKVQNRASVSKFRDRVTKADEFRKQKPDRVRLLIGACYQRRRP